MEVCRRPLSRLPLVSGDARLSGPESGLGSYDIFDFLIAGCGRAQSSATSSCTVPVRGSNPVASSSVKQHLRMITLRKKAQLGSHSGRDAVRKPTSAEDIKKSYKVINAVLLVESVKVTIKCGSISGVSLPAGLHQGDACDVWLSASGLLPLARSRHRRREAHASGELGRSTN